MDETLMYVGECGYYQNLVLYFVLLPCVLPCGFHAYAQLFMASSPKHACRPPPALSLLHIDLASNMSLPPDETSRCFMYDRNYTALSLDRNYSTPERDAVRLIPCQHGWNFDYSEYAATVVTEWEIVCQKDFYTTLALVLLGVGGLVGNYIFGYLQDSLGRRPSFFIYLFIECVFGVATAFAPDFLTWSIFRLGVGFTVPAILGTPYVLAIELVGPSYRTMVTILTNIAYSLGLVFLAVVAYLVRDWRQLALATSVPFVTFFLYWWVLPESPRWLLARGRFEEAEKVLSTMARVNGRTLPPDFIMELKRKYQAERLVKEKEVVNGRDRAYGVSDLFRTPNLRRKTIIITFIWFTNTSVYVGLSYYASILGGDEFLNFFLAGLVELPTYFVLWPSMQRLGRRWTVCVSMLVGGGACLATVLSQQDDVTTLILYCIGKMGISSSYVVLPLMASELYPTVVRGLGMSTSSVAGMLGPVFIPVVNYMGEDKLVLPLVIMGVLLVAGAGCSLLLPETLHQPLPQTLEDGENFASRGATICCPARVNDTPQLSPMFHRPHSILESPIKSLLNISLKDSTPVSTDITSSTDVASDTVFSVHEQTLRVTVV